MKRKQTPAAAGLPRHPPPRLAPAAQMCLIVLYHDDRCDAEDLYRSWWLAVLITLGQLLYFSKVSDGSKTPEVIEAEKAACGEVRDRTTAHAASMMRQDEAVQDFLSCQCLFSPGHPEAESTEGVAACQPCTLRVLR